MRPYDLDEKIEKSKKMDKLEFEEIKILLNQAKEIFLQESNVKEIPTPCTIVGDIHGQYEDLLEMFRVAGFCPNTNFLFLGDYVDRGLRCVETITLLLLLKVRYPERMTLIRGNHESASLTQMYGFMGECTNKYPNNGVSIWKMFLDVFNFLPVSAIVGQRLFCCHGGLSPEVQTIDQIRVLDRFQEMPHSVSSSIFGPLSDLLWSDPDEVQDGFNFSPRGAGYLFGKDIVNAFLHRNKVTHVVRAHQLCNEGYQLYFYNTVVTVWSAPNYCYRCGNIASVLEVDDTLNMFFNTYFSPLREVPNTQQAAAPVAPHYYS